MYMSVCIALPDINSRSVCRLSCPSLSEFTQERTRLSSKANKDLCCTCISCWFSKTRASDTSATDSDELGHKTQPSDDVFPFFSSATKRKAVQMPRLPRHISSKHPRAKSSKVYHIPAPQNARFLLLGNKHSQHTPPFPPSSPSPTPSPPRRPESVSPTGYPSA